MRDLGTLGGGRSSAYGINEAGQVVGASDMAERLAYAFITGPDGMGMRDLGTLGINSVARSGINDAGQVVGEFGAASGRLPCFHYRRQWDGYERPWTFRQY